MILFGRGNGYLAPLLLVLSVIFMIPSTDLGVKRCQIMALAWIIVAGVWVVWYGRKKLLTAAAELGRPLSPHEWVLDLAIFQPRPFHSFLLVQMPWWGLVYAFASFKFLRLILEP